VVEALEPAHVAHRGLGDDHALEAARRLDERRVDDRPDLRDAHEVAQRDDTDEAAAVDHGDVAVPVLREAVERVLHVDVRRDAVRLLRHPLRHLRAVGTRAGRAEADEVALGEDADRPIAVDHDH
jgi:hypothetical protein